MFSQKYNDEKHILKVRNEIKNELISFHSPLIRKRIEEIAKYEAINKNAIPDPYLTDLAKVHIFMDKFRSRTKNPLLGEMFEEQLFATYEYCKDNNLNYSNFDDLFNNKKFFTFLGVTTDDKWFLSNILPFVKEENKEYTSESGKYVSLISKRIAINKHSTEIDISGYNASLNHTGTHETQHFVTGKGTYDKKYLFGGYLNVGQNNLNELCIERIATNIIKNYLDDNIKSKTVEKSFDTGNKITFTSDSKDYQEFVVFYDSLNHISGNKLEDICYTKGKNIDSIGNPEIVNKILDFTESLGSVCDKNDKTKLLEQNFDAMIDSFSSLAEKYVRNLGLNKSTTPDSLEGAITFKRVEEFFNTFDSITFQKDGENFTQKELIKEKVLGAIYYNDKSSEEAINRLNNKRTFVKEFEKKCKTATETIEKSKTSESEITTSIEKTKENETTKDNSKSDDLEL
ncbi:MAG: hypothetical protein E7273_10615 [Pseudobutyrivibrio ruminis]|nr:hypothetical protein [Pseudobutyrivibrio ruminis]